MPSVMSNTPAGLASMGSTTKTILYQNVKISQELEEVLKRIADIKNIAGVMVINSDGITVKSTLDNTLSSQYSVLISQLCDRSKSIVRDLDPSNELMYMRIKSRKHEILVAPEDDFILIVVQNPCDPIKGD